MNRHKIAFILLAVCGLVGNLQAEKILLLIIASDNFPVYAEFEKSWRSYMHSDPEHIEAYFLRGDPSLSAQVAIEGDTIWAKTSEGFPEENPGIINKTILAFEALLPRIKTEFDYVVRANLSSFYVFPRLFRFLETLPKTRCYAGSQTGPNSIVISGTGIILSPDLVELLVQNKEELLNDAHSPDDCLIGYFFKKEGIGLCTCDRLEVLSLDTWNQMKQHPLPSEPFLFRVKTSNRMPDDLLIHADLYEMFYRR